MEHSKDWHRDAIAKLESIKSDIHKYFQLILAPYLILISISFAFLMFYTREQGIDKIYYFSAISAVAVIFYILFALIFIRLSRYLEVPIKNNYKALLEEG